MSAISLDSSVEVYPDKSTISCDMIVTFDMVSKVELTSVLFSKIDETFNVARSIAFALMSGVSISKAVIFPVEFTVPSTFNL